MAPAGPAPEPGLRSAELPGLRPREGGEGEAPLTLAVAARNVATLTADTFSSTTRLPKT